MIAERRPVSESSQQRLSGAFGISFAIHAVAIAVMAFLALRPQPMLVASQAVSDSIPSDIVWLNLPGPAGGGGGGGSQSPAPPRKAQEIGRDKITVPAVKPASLELTRETTPPVQIVDAPVETLASAMLPIAGVIEKGMLDGESRGAGRGPGAGRGNGSGAGDGQGAGFGNGSG